MVGGSRIFFARFDRLAYVVKVAILFAVYFIIAELGIMMGGIIGFTILVCAPAALTILILYAYIAERRRVVLDLKKVNDELEMRVDERTSVLVEINKSLVEAQRKARLGSWEWDIPQNKIIYSDQMYNIYGIFDLKPDKFDVTYQGLCKYVHPDDHIMFEKTIANSINTGLSFSFDCRIIRPDGAMRVIHWEGSVSKEGDVSRDQLGKAVRVFGTAQDITERRRLEEERNRIFNVSLDLLYIAKFDGYFKDVNSALGTILGYSKEELLKIPFMNLVHPNDREVVDKELKKLSKGMETSYFECRVICRNGMQKWLLLSAIPLVAKGLIYGVGKDITDLKNTGERLYRTNYILQNALEGISQLDAERRYTFVNSAYAKMFSHTPEEMVGMEWKETIPRGDWEKVENAYNAMLSTGRAEVETRGLRKDGVSFYKRDILVKAYDSEDKYIGYYNFTFVRDVAERKAAEEALEEANRELASSLIEVEQRASEVTTLNKFNDMLQSCRSYEEVSDVLMLSAKQLFAGWGGAFYRINAARSIAETVSTWGIPLLGNRKFHLDECWALKLGKPYWGAEEGLFCSHLGRLLSISYMCIPIIAQNEVFGILHLQIEREKLNRSGDMKNIQQKRNLATTFAGNIGMTLSNLKMREILRDQAIRDPLTSLFNRRFMEEWFDKELLEMERSKQPLTILMLDIDGFKKINDTYGHEIGDAMLRELSYVLKNIVRGSDVMARFGGDEAIVIMPNAPTEDGLKRAEHIKEAAKRINVTQYDSRLAPLTVSLGVASYPRHGRSRDTLLKSADVALYRAKNEGRDRVVVAGEISLPGGKPDRVVIAEREGERKVEYGGRDA